MFDNVREFEFRCRFDATEEPVDTGPTDQEQENNGKFSIFIQENFLTNFKKLMITSHKVMMISSKKISNLQRQTKPKTEMKPVRLTLKTTTMKLPRIIPIRILMQNLTH